MSSQSEGGNDVQGKETHDDFVVLKLDHGEDLMGCLQRAILQFDIKSGFILTGIGMLKDVEIGFFGGGEYQTKSLEEPHELISLHGSISTKGETIIHLHCSLANREHRIVGGHLNKGTVNVINEIFIKKTNDVELGRRRNQDTGLKELYII
jgi:predicted DNA-binding protein with PD1-like motif